MVAFLFKTAILRYPLLWPRIWRALAARIGLGRLKISSIIRRKQEASEGQWHDSGRRRNPGIAGPDGDLWGLRRRHHLRTAAYPAAHAVRTAMGLSGRLHPSSPTPLTGGSSS